MEVPDGEVHGEKLDESRGVLMPKVNIRCIMRLCRNLCHERLPAS